MRYAALAACLVLALPPLAAAQTPAPKPAGPEFLPRAQFHLAANALAPGDEQSRWDAYYGGEVDLVDYVVGRASIVADYHPVLGDELRPFDPNQAYYVLEASSSYRAGDLEIAGVFHHVSRHLSDRPKPFAIAWNVLGVRVMRRVTRNGVTIDWRGDVGSVVQHSFADYSWNMEGDVVVRRAISPRVGVFVHATTELFTVDGSIPDRGTQAGGRLEGGVRFSGRAGALELFAGVERRLDADPLDRQSERWALAGFRLLSR